MCGPSSRTRETMYQGKHIDVLADKDEQWIWFEGNNPHEIQLLCTTKVEAIALANSILKFFEGST